jgi:cytoskeletal protein RodZ
MITAGEVLKNKRESLGKSIETASLDTKIQRRFLQYIENNQFSFFDSEVFLTGFIKIYAQYLNLDVDKVLALYRRSNPKRKEPKSLKKEPKLPKRGIRADLLNPKTVITTLLILFLTLIIGYIGFQIYKFQSPPELNITEPLSDIETKLEEISVKGKTEINTTVEINGTSLEPNDNGTFEKIVKLNEGINIITIRARKDGNNTLETVVTRKVTLIKPQEDSEDGDQSPESILKLEITDSSAWIRLDIDDENKLSQVVEPSTLEYPVNNKFYIITGRVSSTKLYYNNIPVEWRPTQTTGVAELSCTVSEFTITCE